MRLINHIVFFAVFCFLVNSGLCQTNRITKIDSLNYISKQDTLELLYLKNKKIPNDHLLSFLIALSYYPELNRTRIIIKHAQIKTTLNARPSLFSTLFKSELKRKNIIRINNSTKQGKVLIDQVDFNSKIGLLGHELAHIYDFNQVKTLGVIKKAFAYLSTRGKKKIEHDTDMEVIQRGLGWQLYDWNYFVLYKSCASEKYKSYKRKIYLTPDQIVDQIKLEENSSNQIHLTQTQ